MRTARNVPPLRPLRAAMLQRLRRLMVFANENVREGFVITQDDVEAWLQLLDQVRFQQQRLCLTRRDDELHRPRQRDHPRDALCLPADLGITRDARALRAPKPQNPTIDNNYSFIQLLEVWGIELGLELRGRVMGALFGGLEPETEGEVWRLGLAASRGVGHGGVLALWNYKVSWRRSIAPWHRLQVGFEEGAPGGGVAHVLLDGETVLNLVVLRLLLPGLRALGERVEV